MSKLKDITMMRPTERFHYLKNRKKKCPSCDREKNLLCFLNKDDVKINKKCNACVNKLYRESVKKLVLSIIKREGVVL